MSETGTEGEMPNEAKMLPPVCDEAGGRREAGCPVTLAEGADFFLRPRASGS
jgi:hypothetical protein